MTTTESHIAVSSGEDGLFWSGAGMSAADKAFGEDRPPRFVKYSVTSESEPELAESSDEESSDEAETGCAKPSRKETVEAVMFVPRERAQQWSAKPLRDVQFREWLVKSVPWKEGGGSDA